MTNRLFSYFVGPEGYWAILYILLLAFIKISGAPAKRLDPLFESFWYLVPLILVPLSYGLLALPWGDKSWLLLRLALVGIVGSHLMISKSLSSYSEQGPGVGMGYLAGISFVIAVIGAITIFIWVRRWFFS